MPPINYTIAHPRTGDVTTDASNGRRAFSADIGAPRLCCAFVLKADTGNSVTVYVGEGNPTYPLAPGEVLVIDLPPNVLIDLAKFNVRTTTATGGQIVHAKWFEIVGNPPQGTAKKGGTPDDLNAPATTEFVEGQG